MSCYRYDEYYGIMLELMFEINNNCTFADGCRPEVHRLSHEHPHIKGTSALGNGLRE